MYKLTPKMEQHFRKSLATYHQLFDGGRCSGWELEELIATSIRADNNANHLAKWKEAGHDDEADITISTKNKTHYIQIKSGQIKTDRKGAKKLTLSGHRLGRFNQNLNDITKYLNNRKADFISVPYRKHEDNLGRQHIYRLCYIPAHLLTGLDSTAWQKNWSQYKNKNKHGVEFSLHPSMSWQIWWKIPLEILNPNQEFTDGNFI